MTLWLLACFGYTLPVMAQLLSQTAARQAFVRRCVGGRRGGEAAAVYLHGCRWLACFAALLLLLDLRCSTSG